MKEGMNLGYLDRVLRHVVMLVKEALGVVLLLCLPGRLGRLRASGGYEARRGHGSPET